MSELIAEFGIIETPTVFPDEQGILEITVTNQSNEDITGATLDLYASTDRVLDIDPSLEDEGLNNIEDIMERPDDPDGTDDRSDISDENLDALEGTDERLGTIEEIDLAAGKENTFTIDFASNDFRTASVVSPGAYYLIAEADSDESSQAIEPISSEGTDVVLDWNSVFLNAVQAEGKVELGEMIPEDADSLGEIPGVAPPVVALNGAIQHIAVYEAVNALSDSFDGGNSSLDNLPDIPEGASQEAAAVGAAYTVLSELFVEQPREDSDLSDDFLNQQQKTFDLQRDISLEDISDDSAAETAGFDFGVEVAEIILEDRSNDGAAQGQDEYTPGNAAGDYKEIREPNPTEPLPPSENLTENGLVEVTALLPEWEEVIPFAIDSTARFRPEGPPAFSSPNYAEDIEDVRIKGGLVDTDVTTVERTDKETEIAQFWSYDRTDTFRPPGQWNQIAQEAVLEQEDMNFSIEDNALLFAQLNIAMADAGIVAWDGKYAYEQLRPITAIRNADDDNNPNTTADPDWEPLITTPNFPDYISGHSAFGGAAAGVLEEFFGDDVVLELPTQELPGVYHEFTSSGGISSFRKAADENADSRLFGGVHVDISNVDGVQTGLDVANYILNEGNIFA